MATHSAQREFAKLMSVRAARFLLPAVFCTGAAVLLVEVLATRILAPYFGNTIITISSVLGVILAALSLGYAVGGRWADRAPAFDMFYGLIGVAGASLLLLHALMARLFPLLTPLLTLLTGPPVFSVVLFFVPSFLLGTLSPIAIRLQALHLPARGLGKVAGDVFAWSTVGSIVGSFAAGFLLIPHFGVSRIAIATGVFLVGLGVVGFLTTRRVRTATTGLVALSFMGVGLAGALLGIDHPRAVYVRDGVYERVLVVDGTYNGRPTRFLFQDRSASAAMYLDGIDLVYDYTKFFALPELLGVTPRRFLVLGGGAYSIPKAALQRYPEARVDVADIEPSLVDVARRFFRLPNDSRLTSRVVDGRQFLRGAGETYDVIFSDAFNSLFSIPLHFTTREFFTLARERLSPGGAFVANLIGDLSRQEPSLLFSEIRTMQAVFPQVLVFAVRSPAARVPQNVIAVGLNRPDALDLSSPKLTTSTDPLLRGLTEKAVDLRRFELSASPVLTDDFAPVEYFTAFLLRRAVPAPVTAFDGREALALVAQQLRYGPRFLGSPGHQHTEEFLAAELRALGAEVHGQSWEHTLPSGKQVRLSNVVGRLFPEQQQRIILAAHYDTRRYADKDPVDQRAPLPGANDGASGVAVLLELTRTLVHAQAPPRVGVDVVFFDGEEGEPGVSDRDWRPLGSQYFVQHLGEISPGRKPAVGVVLDMVCDRGLQILKEPSSVRQAPDVVERFWRVAHAKFPGTFPDERGPEILDDHAALNAAGIPSMLLIDFDYPPFHTTKDTLAQCSAESLGRVGSSLVQYLYTLP